MKSKLPLNPKIELLKWGPIIARFYNISDFIDGIFKLFPKAYPGELWPKTMAIIQEKQIIWINEFPEIRKHGGSVFLKYMVPEKMRQKAYGKWKKDLEAVNKAEKEIEKINLPDLNHREFIAVWEKFQGTLFNFWKNVTIPELANYSSDKILERELKKCLKNEAEVANAMEILIAPEKLSFYKKEELALLKTKNIKQHAKKYFWLKNSYAGTEFLDGDYFVARKKKLLPNLKSHLKEARTKIQKRKKEWIKKYKPNQKIIKIVKAIVMGMEWQDERKADIFVYLHYKNLLIEEAARRLAVTKSDLLNFGTREILEFLEGKSTATIKKRKNGFAVVIDKERMEYLDSKTAKKFWNIYVEEKTFGNVKNIVGIVVSRGRGVAKGKVKIIINPSERLSFKKGDILVAPMTSPEYIFLMKKAAAVITDTGGITSHAAIVSRELNIPCIIGTKIATKVLHDGDYIEVDAERGMVKVIKKSK